MSITVMWPEIIENLDFNYPDNLSKDDLISFALSDGLVAWANLSQDKPPENFGKGMVKIGKILQIVPTGENLLKYADDRHKRLMNQSLADKSIIKNRKKRKK